ncbi:preprotein translocase subunit YajC [Altererythrobacter sp. TH136]|uniref:preprotein translocase subunit YajC n=1 Tax=Altererythrobacter sp. TH136 TaxID=2067415 RepID=UPI001FEF64CB|nr:preprotein translocase subunit YajC [Altererythrobacter sp. TH136]
MSVKAWTLASVIGLAATIAVVPASAQQADQGQRSRNVRTAPYIEANQVLTAELSPGSDAVTYTQVAAGVDLSVQGRNNGGAASVRFEQTLGYDSRMTDSSTLSGVARGYASVVPRAVTVEAGALATRTRIDSNGGATIGSGRDRDNESRVYSAYAGPTVHTRVGDAEVNANYRIGYTRAEAPEGFATAPGAPSVDVFEDSVVQSAGVHAATRAGDGLPVGVGVGAGYYQEDISNLDQRVRDAHFRADVSVPLTPALAAVAGAGYENVKISSRDAVRTADGAPVIGADGRFVTDKSAPRQLAYETEGLIWDVGVMWRPSRRTRAEAHVGKRYDSTTYYGSFAWAPSSRSSVNIAVYDGITGFGGQLTNALVALPADFAANRNAITGDVTGCVASLQGSNCLTGVLGSIRSAVFRGRGINASYARQIGRMSAGVGMGYDRSKFIAAPGTVLGSANGVVDESYWAAAYLSGQIDARSSFNANAYANWLTSDFAGARDASVIGASAAYRRYLLDGLSANAAVGLDHLNGSIAGQDLTTASALLGLRYDFN